MAHVPVAPASPRASVPPLPPTAIGGNAPTAANALTAGVDACATVVAFARIVGRGFV